MSGPVTILVWIMTAVLAFGLITLWYLFPNSPVPIIGLVVVLGAAVWAACSRPSRITRVVSPDDDDAPPILPMRG